MNNIKLSYSPPQSGFNKKICLCEGCDKKPHFNKIGELNPKYCYTHKHPNMINVYNSFRFS